MQVRACAHAHARASLQRRLGVRGRIEAVLRIETKVDFRTINLVLTVVPVTHVGGEAVIREGDGCGLSVCVCVCVCVCARAHAFG